MNPKIIINYFNQEYLNKKEKLKTQMNKLNMQILLYQKIKNKFNF